MNLSIGYTMLVTLDNYCRRRHSLLLLALSDWDTQAWLSDGQTAF